MGLRAEEEQLKCESYPRSSWWFHLCLFGFLLISPMQDCTYLVFHLIWIEFILIPFWIQLNNSNKKKHHGSGSGVQSKWGLHQSGTSWNPVITASSYKVAVLIISLINYVTHSYINATQNTPHKRSPGEGLQSLIALFVLVLCVVCVVCVWFFCSFSVEWNWDMINHDGMSNKFCASCVPSDVCAELITFIW